MTPTLQLELRGGRRWLWAAFAAHLLALAVFVVLGKLELTVVVLQLVAAVLSLVGVWLLTDTFNTPPIGRLVSLAASVVAGLGLVPVVFYLWRTHQKTNGVVMTDVNKRALRAAFESQEINQAQYNASKFSGYSQSPSQWEQLNSKRERIRKNAIPVVVLAGLASSEDSEAVAVPQAPEGMPLSGPDAAICLTAKRIFGVYHVLENGDRPNHYLSRRELSDAEIALVDLVNLGRHNLVRMILESEKDLEFGQLGNVYRLKLDDRHEASLVLIDALWDGPLQRYVPKGALVAIPTRDACLFCDARSPEAVAELERYMRSLKAIGSTPLSSELFYRRRGQWSVYDPAQSEGRPTKPSVFPRSRPSVAPR